MCTKAYLVMKFEYVKFLIYKCLICKIEIGVNE